MEIKEFKEYVVDIDNFSPSEIDEFEIMSSGELYTYQRELEKDSGNLSSWDHLRAFITLKKKLDDLDK